MKNTKRIYYCFGIWECEKEAKLLTDRSASGWNLSKAHSFGATLEKSGERYVYQIDRNTNADVRYFDTFREMGWEYLDTVNECHYFRRKYDPDIPAGGYEIYSDTESRSEALKRDSRFFGALTLLEAAALGWRIWEHIGDYGFSIGSVHSLLSLLSLAVCFAMMLTVTIQLSQTRRGKTSASGKIIIAALLMLLLILALDVCTALF